MPTKRRSRKKGRLARRNKSSSPLKSKLPEFQLLEQIKSEVDALIKKQKQDISDAQKEQIIKEFLDKKQYIIEAVNKNYPEVVKYLISQKANVDLTQNDNDITLFYVAVSNNYLQIAELLGSYDKQILDKIVTVNQSEETSIVRAIFQNNQPMVELLLKLGCDPNAQLKVKIETGEANKTAFDLAVLKGNFEIFKLIINHENTNLDILKQALQFSLKNIANPNSILIAQALKSAINKKEPEFNDELDIKFNAEIKAKIQQLTNLNKNNRNFNLNEEIIKFINQQSYLFTAGLLNYAKTVKFLIDNYPKIITHKDNNGNTLLHIVATQGNEIIFNILLENTPSLATIKNNSGKKPIVFAVFSNLKTLVQSLIRADTTYKQDRENWQSALHIAAKPERMEILKILLRAYPTFFKNKKDKWIISYKNLLEKYKISNPHLENDYNEILNIIDGRIRVIEEKTIEKKETKQKLSESKIIIELLENITENNNLETLKKHLQNARIDIINGLFNKAEKELNLNLFALLLENRNDLKLNRRKGKAKTTILQRMIEKRFALQKESKSEINDPQIQDLDEIIKLLVKYDAQIILKEASISSKKWLEDYYLMSLLRRNRPPEVIMVETQNKNQEGYFSYQILQEILKSSDEKETKEKQRVKIAIEEGEKIILEKTNETLNAAELSSKKRSEKEEERIKKEEAENIHKKLRCKNLDSSLACKNHIERIGQFLNQRGFFEKLPPNSKVKLKGSSLYKFYLNKKLTPQDIDLEIVMDFKQIPEGQNIKEYIANLLNLDINQMEDFQFWPNNSDSKSPMKTNFLETIGFSIADEIIGKIDFVFRNEEMIYGKLDQDWVCNFDSLRIILKAQDNSQNIIDYEISCHTNLDLGIILHNLSRDGYSVNLRNKQLNKTLTRYVQKGIINEECCEEILKIAQNTNHGGIGFISGEGVVYLPQINQTQNLNREIPDNSPAPKLNASKISQIAYQARNNEATHI